MLQRDGSETGAANGALAHLGEPPVPDLDARKAAARACRERFAPVRDALLAEHDWNFAEAWDTPAADPAAPRFPFAYGYPLKGEVLVVREVEGLSTNAWAVTDGDDGVKVLVTDQTAPRVRYTRVVGPDRWDPLFLEVFELRLAVAVAPKIGRSETAARAKLADAERRLLVAKRIDAQERAPREVSRDTSWLRARI